MENFKYTDNNGIAFDQIKEVRDKRYYISVYYSLATGLFDSDTGRNLQEQKMRDFKKAYAAYNAVNLALAQRELGINPDENQQKALKQHFATLENSRFTPS